MCGHWQGDTGPVQSGEGGPKQEGVGQHLAVGVVALWA